MQIISLLLGIVSILNNVLFCGSNAENLQWLFAYNVPITLVGIVVSVVAIKNSNPDESVVNSKIGLACCLLTVLYYGGIVYLLYLTMDI